MWGGPSPVPRAGRGGARVTAFDASAMPPVADAVGAQAVWDNLAYFLRAVAPAAQEAGVRLGLHPDDPPVPSLQNHARVPISTDALLRAVALAGSPAVGVTFC